MRFTIDTTLERIIVPDSFFNQIDKMDPMLAEREAADKKSTMCSISMKQSPRHSKMPPCASLI